MIRSCGPCRGEIKAEHDRHKYNDLKNGEHSETDEELWQRWLRLIVEQHLHWSVEGREREELVDAGMAVLSAVKPILVTSPHPHDPDDVIIELSPEAIRALKRVWQRLWRWQDERRADGLPGLPALPVRRTAPRPRARRERHVTQSTSSQDPGDDDPDLDEPPLGPERP